MRYREVFCKCSRQPSWGIGGLCWFVIGVPPVNQHSYGEKTPFLTGKLTINYKQQFSIAIMLNLPGSMSF
jgi:hypothetical protein